MAVKYFLFLVQAYHPMVGAFFMTARTQGESIVKEPKTVH